MSIRTIQELVSRRENSSSEISKVTSSGKLPSDRKISKFAERRGFYKMKDPAQRYSYEPLPPRTSPKTERKSNNLPSIHETPEQEAQEKLSKILTDIETLPRDEKSPKYLTRNIYLDLQLESFFKFLETENIDINSCDSKDGTFLCKTLSYFHKDLTDPQKEMLEKVLHTLFRKGANPNVDTIDGQTPFSNVIDGLLKSEDQSETIQKQWSNVALLLILNPRATINMKKEANERALNELKDKYKDIEAKSPQFETCLKKILNSIRDYSFCDKPSHEYRFTSPQIRGKIPG